VEDGKTEEIDRAGKRRRSGSESRRKSEDVPGNMRQGRGEGRDGHRGAIGVVAQETRQKGGKRRRHERRGRYPTGARSAAGGEEKRGKEDMTQKFDGYWEASDALLRGLADRSLRKEKKN